MLKSVSFFIRGNKHILNRFYLYSAIKWERTLHTNSEQIPSTCNKIFFTPSFCRYFSNSIDRMMDFTEAKAKYLNLSLEEKRAEYSCKSNFVTLDAIVPWSEQAKTVNPHNSPPVCSYKPQLNKKVSLFVGDITALEIDAIVNAANSALRGGGGVDGAIHRSAGPMLLAECKSLNGCDTGDAKLTGGYKLPAKYVIQTVGPMGEKTELLSSCYQRSLLLAKENQLRTIAFPCISTGIYGYPNQKAAHVAIGTVREFLEQNEESFDRIIFCLFLQVDVDLYEALMQEYFPIQ